MRGPGWRILAVIGWCLGGLVAWVAGCTAAGFALMYFVNERHARVPEGTFAALNAITVVGVVVVPPVAAVLAIRGKLPWCGRRASGRRGFPVDPPPPGDE